MIMLMMIIYMKLMLKNIVMIINSQRMFIYVKHYI